MFSQPSSVPVRRSLDTTSNWVLMATLVIALVLVTSDTFIVSTVAKTVVLAAGALISLGVFILARLTHGNIVFPSSVLLPALWLPTIAYLLSAAFSGTSFSSAFWGTTLEPDTFGFMLIAAVLGTVAMLTLRRVEHYRSFFTFGAYVFGAIALFQVLTLMLGQLIPNTVSPTFSLLGGFGDLASFFGLGVVLILLALRFLTLSEKAKRALLGSGALAMVSLAVANSSLIWVLLALVSLGLFVESIMRQKSEPIDTDLEETVVVNEVPVESAVQNRSLILPLVVLVISLFFLIGGMLGGALASALHVNVLDVRPSWQSTFTTMEKTYATMSAFGSGPGTFGEEWLKHRFVTLNATPFWNVDFQAGIGFIPTSFVTTGILGLLAWVSLVALFIGFGLRMLLVRTPQDPFVRYVSISSFIGALYLFAIAFFDLPSTVMLALLFVFAGLFISTTRFAENGRQLGILFSRSPRLGFVIVFALTILLLSSVVAAYALVERTIASIELTRANGAFAAGNLDAAERAVQDSLSFAQSPAAYRLGAAISKAQIDTIAASSTMDKTAAQQAYQQALSTGINAALTATNLAPSDYQGWLLLGSLYAQAVPLGVAGSYDSAKTAYQKAQNLNPTNPQILYATAQLDLANKDTAAAKNALKAAVSLKQDYTPAIFLLSQLEVRDGNVKDALDAALAAAYFTPNDPNILFQVGVLYAAQNDFANAAAALSAAVAANPQFANARYLLAAIFAKEGDIAQALQQVKALAALSSENATALEPQISALEAGKNPFPANLLTISSTTPVK